MLTTILCSLLASPDWRVRDWADRHTPWPVMVALVPAHHPDAEVRLRWRRSVPAWYRELTPEFLYALVTRNDLRFLNADFRRRFLLSAWRYSNYWWPANADQSPYWCKEICDGLKSKR